MKSRFERPPFNLRDWEEARTFEGRNRLLFDWWCVDEDRLAFIQSLDGKPTRIPSRSPWQDDPCPPLTDPAAQGYACVYLLSNPQHVRQALEQPDNFSNLPYGALGRSSFLLGLDPEQPGSASVDWHARQKAFVTAAFVPYYPASLRELAWRSVEQAALTCLARPEFDLSHFAEQATLRYLGQLYGFGFQDHALLEDASRASYRALQYLTIGKHFVSEVGTIPAAQRALGRLVDRSSELMEDYYSLERSPKKFGPKATKAWPDGVQPWSEGGLHIYGLEQPLLKWAASAAGPGYDSLSGRDRATVLATMLAGTVGNVQTAVCLLVQSLLTQESPSRFRLVPPVQRNERFSDHKLEVLEQQLQPWLASLPPVPVLPRRTRHPVSMGGVMLPEGADCLLLLEGGRASPHAIAACPHVWGNVPGEPAAAHACLGQSVSMHMIAAMVRFTLLLDGLRSTLDPTSGKRLEFERLWGFGSTRYALRYDREKERVQQNLIVSMRVKHPVGENAAHLRRLIAGAVPRIDEVLTGFGRLHFAWFEFSEDDSRLVLRTIYDGALEPYLNYFALNAGDLFDGLFEFLEDAPPRPVAEHPEAFIEAIRRVNSAPLAGYLYSAYPRAKADAIVGRV